SAAAHFTQIRDNAKEQGLPQFLKLADEHLAAIAPLVPHLSVRLTENLAGTHVLVDDQLVAAGELASIAVDPGDRTIVVNAPDRLPYRTRITIKKAAHQDVVVPALAQSIVVRSSKRRIGQITTIVGAVAAGTGLGLGLYARHSYDAQFDGSPPNCTKADDRKLCNSAGLSKTHSAQTLGNVGTIVGITGVVVAGVGAYLWITAPRTTAGEAPRKLAVVPSISPDALGVVAVGRF
ncbi:MAG TPA: hypothetical protein VGC42_20435, partial [Kofleriaceae bacterium]